MVETRPDKVNTSNVHAVFRFTTHGLLDSWLRLTNQDSPADDGRRKIPCAREPLLRWDGYGADESCKLLSLLASRIAILSGVLSWHFWTRDAGCESIHACDLRCILRDALRSCVGAQFAMGSEPCCPYVCTLSVLRALRVQSLNRIPDRVLCSCGCLSDASYRP